jgi:hypothetical protein
LEKLLAHVIEVCNCNWSRKVFNSTKLADYNKKYYVRTRSVTKDREKREEKILNG